MDEQKKIEVAKQSLIKEKIKENELLKFYELNQDDELIEEIMKNFYTKLGINNKESFKIYLENFDLSLNDIKKKIEIETMWNRLVYEKYKNKIQINKSRLKERVNLQDANKKRMLLLSEIVFEKNNQQNLKKMFNEIKKSIDEIGFENTANIYSTAESAKYGGNIGWINEQNLSTQLVNELKKIKINEISYPISNGSNFVMLKINNIKEETIKKNPEEELKKLILFEENRQLANYSKIYYNRLKINSLINVQ